MSTPHPNTGTGSHAPQDRAARQRDNTEFHHSQLLGMLLKAPQQLHDADLLDPQDLHRPDDRITLEALRDLALARNGLTEAHHPVLIEMVAARLRRPEYEIAVMFNTLIEECYSTANLVDFAAKVKRAALERRADEALKAGDKRKVHDLVAEQDRIKERLKNPATPSRFIRLSAMGDHPPAVDWLIEDYLERDTVTQLFGDPGSGKSFIALDMALSIATGKEWRGHATSRGPVFYLAGEGLRGLQRRKEAWLRYHGVEDRNAPFWLSDGATALSDPGQRAALMADLDAALVGLGLHLPLLIAIDTLARNFGHGDENSTKDMGAFIAALDALRERYHCCILLVHHSGHADKSRARGAMALLGGLDAEYRVEKIGDDTVQMVSTKQKDNDPPPALAWTLERYDLPWADAQGRPLNSAVLIPNDAVPAARPVKEKIGHQPRRALELLEECYRKQRQNLEDGGYDPETARVTIADWQNAMQNIAEDRGYRNRIRRALLDSGHVKVESGFVYLAK